jgi:1,4-dihydroxy-2-naphthoate octaprenyltransferase
MPVYWFAVSATNYIDITNLVLSFICLHLCIYPASNGFNSYYDKDEKSIGGLETPPPITPDLLFASLFLDIVGIMLALFISWQFALAVLVYGLASKAYSYDKIRLKKYPILSLLVVGFFQGGFIFIIVYQAVSTETWDKVLQFPIVLPAILNSLMLIGSYPMTQIYQHEEDAKRGDFTMSRMLGIRGTFLYTGFVFGIAIAGLSYYFWVVCNDLPHLFMFHVLLQPVLLFFIRWALKCFHNPEKADFKHTMRLNFLSALCLNACFIYFCVEKYLL